MPADIALNLLDRVRIASPCTAKWEDMTGDDKARHCAECNLKVHNFAAMERGEVEAMLKQHFGPDGSEINGRLCGVLYRRADGTVITADCPVGLAKVRERARRAFVRVAAMVGLTTIVGMVAAKVSEGGKEENCGRLRAAALAPFATVHRWLVPPVVAPGATAMIPRGQMMMLGKVNAGLPRANINTGGTSPQQFNVAPPIPPGGGP